MVPSVPLLMMTVSDHALFLVTPPSFYLVHLSTEELSAPRELTDELMGSEISSVLVEGDLSNIWPLRPSSATTPLHSDSGTFQRAPGAEVRTRSFGDDDSQVRGMDHSGLVLGGALAVSH